MTKLGRCFIHFFGILIKHSVVSSDEVVRFKKYSGTVPSLCDSKLIQPLSFNNHPEVVSTLAKGAILCALRKSAALDGTGDVIYANPAETYVAKDMDSLESLKLLPLANAQHIRIGTKPANYARKGSAPSPCPGRAPVGNNEASFWTDAPPKPSTDEDPEHPNYKKMAAAYWWLTETSTRHLFVICVSFARSGGLPCIVFCFIANPFRRRTFN